MHMADEAHGRSKLARVTVGCWLVVFVTRLLNEATVVNGMAQATIFIGGALLACEAQRSLSRGMYNFSAFMLATTSGSLCGTAQGGSSLTIGIVFACALVTFFCAVGLLSRWIGNSEFFLRILRMSRRFGNNVFHTERLTLDTAPGMSRDEFIDEMRSSAEEVLGAVADVINHSAAPAGQIDARSEEIICDLFAQLRQQATETGVQMRMRSAEDPRGSF